MVCLARRSASRLKFERRIAVHEHPCTGVGHHPSKRTPLAGTRNSETCRQLFNYCAYDGKAMMAKNGEELCAIGVMAVGRDRRYSVPVERSFVWPRAALEPTQGRADCVPSAAFGLEGSLAEATRDGRDSRRTMARTIARSNRGTRRTSAAVARAAPLRQALGGMEMERWGHLVTAWGRRGWGATYRNRDGDRSREWPSLLKEDAPKQILVIEKLKRSENKQFTRTLK